MELTIPESILHNEQQILRIEENIITLVGPNGSGKSVILENIFKNKLEESSPLRVISYSSGANESFSSIFKKHITKTKQFVFEELRYDEEKEYNHIDQSIRKFHFDSSWVRFLIFVAITLRNEGRVIDLLIRKNIFSSIEELKRSVYISFPFRVEKSYIDQILNILNKEAKNPEYQSIRRTFLHNKLTALVEHLLGKENEIESRDTGVSKETHKLRVEDFQAVFGKDIDRIFTFLAWSSQNNKFIFREEAKLVLKENFELNQLSDGEYQLLVIYALIDLFDSEDSLFLLDETDSHLYYKNVKSLWNTLSKIDGKIITTTHSADSIVNNNFKNIRLINEGRIETQFIANNLINRLSDLSSESSYQYLLAGQISYIALVEDEFDWFIFRRLCERKISNFDSSVFEKISFIKRNSGYRDSSETFGGAKLDWVIQFNKYNKNPKTQSIFMICDRDNLNTVEIQVSGQLIRNSNRENQMNVNGGNRRHAYLLSWKRREIENYLLSYTMLSEYSLLEEINLHLSNHNQLTENNSGDNDQVRDLDIKSEIKHLYLKEELSEDTIGGIDYEKLKCVINKIPPSEISEDIENMYNFLRSKIT